MPASSSGPRQENVNVTFTHRACNGNKQITCNSSDNIDLQKKGLHRTGTWTLETSWVTNFNCPLKFAKSHFRIPSKNFCLRSWMKPPLFVLLERNKEWDGCDIRANNQIWDTILQTKREFAELLSEKLLMNVLQIRPCLSSEKNTSLSCVEFPKALPSYSRQRSAKLQAEKRLRGLKSTGYVARKNIFSNFVSSIKKYRFLTFFELSRTKVR